MIDLLRSLPVNKDSGADWFESPNNYPKLKELAADLKPRSILEIGVRLGYSAISFLHGSNAHTYVGLDCQQYISNSNSGASQNLEHYRTTSGKVFTFELITMNTQELNDLGFLNGRTFDLVHVDGDHSEDGALHDLELFWGAVSVGGFMVVDDSIFIKPVRRAIERFLPIVNTPNWEVPTFRGSWVIQRTC